MILMKFLCTITKKKVNNTYTMSHSDDDYSESIHSDETISSDESIHDSDIEFIDDRDLDELSEVEEGESDYEWEYE